MTRVPQMYDVAVVGLGIAGSMAAWSAASRGLNVVAIDGGRPGHRMGASHGGSRIWRALAWESPEHSAWARRSLAVFARLQGESGVRLCEPTMGVVIGRADSAFVHRVIANAVSSGIDHEVLPAPAAATVLPQFVLRPDDVVVREHGAHIIRPEAAVTAAVQAAAQAGGDVCREVQVERVERNREGWVLRGPGWSASARRVILATGAWLGRADVGLPVPIEPRRVVQAWFDPFHPQHFQIENFPVFVRETDVGRFWGIPCHDGRGVKVGSSSSPWTDTCSSNASVPARHVERAHLGQFVDRWLPGLKPQPAHSQPCLDGYTEDGRFVIQALPGAPTILAIGGLSGHGFKHAGVVGEIAGAWAAGSAVELHHRVAVPPATSTQSRPIHALDIHTEAHGGRTS